MTEPASSITQTSATLNAAVNPEGGAVSDCHFEYGGAESYGSTLPCASLPGSGENPVAVSASLGGLSANTTYHFRIVATNLGGPSYGGDQTFTTPPTPSPSHWYRSGTQLHQGEPLSILSWGTLTLTPEPAAPPTTCETVAGGSIENPVGGGPGVAQTSAFASWNCTNAGCPPGKVKFGEAEYEKDLTLTSGQMPWHSMLTKDEIGKTRFESSGVQMILACVAHDSRKASEGPGSNEPIELAVPTICVTTEAARLTPMMESGHNTTLTAKLAFDSNSGALSCAGGAFKGKISGKLKIIAFKESEVISAKSP